MKKALVPISAIRFDEEQTYSPEAVAVLYELGFLDDDSCTYTAQVRVDHGEDRAEVSRALREKLSAEDAERLISFLDAHGWDASFYVTWGDC